MLGKTAGGLFWMFRFLERSENTARLLDAGFRIALTRSTAAENEWASVVATAGNEETQIHLGWGKQGHRPGRRAQEPSPFSTARMRSS